MDCGCKDKDVKGIAEASAKRNEQFEGLSSSLSGLALTCMEHNKWTKVAGQLGSAKVKDFENPAVLANAKLIANKYSSLVQRLSYLLGKVITESFAEKVKIAKRLDELQQAAPQAHINSTKSRTKKGK